MTRAQAVAHIMINEVTSKGCERLLRHGKRRQLSVLIQKRIPKLLPLKYKGNNNGT